MSTRSAYLNAFYDRAGRDSAVNLEPLFTELLDMALPETSHLPDPAKGTNVNLPTVTRDGRCASCGGVGLVLAQDLTRITQVSRVSPGAGWHLHLRTQEEVTTEVRLFCDSCGTYFEVPKDLE